MSQADENLAPVQIAGAQAGPKKEDAQKNSPEKTAQGTEKKKEEAEKKPQKARHWLSLGRKAQIRDEELKKELLARGEISVILDTYDDIFSDFDPRPYSQRGLSEDFLAEAKKAASATADGNHLHLGFMIPKLQRNPEHEGLIKKRLREYFKKRAENLQAEKNRIVQKGAAMALIGFALILTASYVVSLERKEFIYSVLLVVLEPGGWFLAWSGLDAIFMGAQQKDEEIIFNRRMGKAEIVFAEY